jgi:transglutaminase-like putative cysteine protease
MASKATETSALLSRSQSLWLIASALVTLAPLVAFLPAWLGATAALGLLLRAWTWWIGRGALNRWLLIALVAMASAAVMAAYGTVFGREPGVAMLVLFLVLKLLEGRTRRDALTAIFLCYFLQIALFFEQESPLLALASAIALVVVTAALLALNSTGERASSALRTAASMLGQAVPFMLALFVLFPRLPGPLWGMPSESADGMTGLSETMAPGSISQLSQSSEIAFRAEFDGSPPPARQLYWRGPVLTAFDGLTWRPTLGRPTAELPYRPDGPAIDYAVTLEPHNRQWIFALDLPGTVPRDSQVGPEYQLLSRLPVRSRVRYELVSHPGFTAGAQEKPERLAAARRLPPGSNPRAGALAADWAAASPHPQALAERILAHFRSEPFFYTLSPPLLGQHSVDDFLFGSRRGFCEHYSAAFVFLMRAAGFPARVVTGYQGGEVNPVDGYLTVRQSDAHAWAEIWVEGRGWLRYDPTAAVAPNRVERGIAAALPASEPLPLLVRADADWVRALHFRWEAVANAWNQWVLGYNAQRQRELLSRLGMPNPDWQTMAAALTVVAGTLMLILVAWAMRERLDADPVQRAWLRVSRKLARVGLARQAWEGPSDYARRVGSARPDLAEQVEAIAAGYAKLRYGQGNQTELLPELRTRIRQLRPRAHR